MPRALVLVLVAASLAAFGGVYRWATLPIVFGAAAVVAVSHKALRFPSALRTLDVALAAIAGIMALQLVPWPAAMRDTLSPHAARVSRVVHLLPLDGDSAYPLSLDPAATWHGLGVYIAAMLVFWATRGLLAHGGVRSLSRGIAWIGGIMAFVALVQHVTTPRLIYGFWEPGVVGAFPFGPFINRNQFAAWLILAIPLAVGHFIAHVRIHMPDLARERQRLRALVAIGGWSIFISILVMTVAVAASFSRSAWVGLAAATVVGWRLSRARGDIGRRRSLFLLVTAAMGMLLALASLDPDQLATRVTSTFEQTGTNRLTIWRETLPMIRDFWVAGVGAGAYGIGMLVYQQTRVPMAHLEPGGWAHFNQAHSHYLQIPAEGGLLLSITVSVALIALVVAIRRVLAMESGEAEWIRIGAVAGLTAVAVQSIWETALRMPANAVLCAVVAAIAVHHREHHPR